jgi:hypothetical protein
MVGRYVRQKRNGKRWLKAKEDAKPKFRKTDALKPVKTKVAKN